MPARPLIKCNLMNTNAVCSTSLLWMLLIVSNLRGWQNQAKKLRKKKNRSQMMHQRSKRRTSCSLQTGCESQHVGLFRYKNRALRYPFNSSSKSCISDSQGLASHCPQKFSYLAAQSLCSPFQTTSYCFLKVVWFLGCMVSPEFF